MTSQLWVYLIFAASILGAAFQTQAGWLFVMSSVATGVVVLAVALARTGLRGVRVRALQPAPAYQGSLIELPVALERDGRGATHAMQVMVPPKPPGWWFGWLRDSLVPDGWAYTTVDLAGGQRQDITLRWPAPVRGEFPVPRLALQCAWPLGLYAYVRWLDEPLKYLVYPVGPALHEVPWLHAALARRGAAMRVEAAPGMLLRGVRDYRPGDAWRQIHWRTTARLGVPHVKETEREAGERLVLWLDLRAEVHTPATIEHMIAVAASLTAYARGLGRQVELACASEAAPEVVGRPGDPALVWLALARAIAAPNAPAGPDGAVLLSPVPVPGWRAWASALVLCSAIEVQADATAFCPVGADISEALATGARAA